MDEKDTKNIDGVMTPQTNDAAPSFDTSQQVVDGIKPDVSINSNGDFNANSGLEEPALDGNETVTPAPVVAEQANEPQSSPVVANEQDTGVMPSRQPEQSQVTITPQTELVRLKEKNKHLKIWLVVLMLLLVAVASALVVYFAQQSKAKSDLKTQQQQNTQLQQQNSQLQQNATQGTIDTLNKQLAAEQQKNTDLQKTIDEQQKLISSYQNTIKQLLSACGTACSNVTIPSATGTTNNSTTNQTTN